MDRKPAFFAWAKANGLDPSAYETQVSYAIKELNSTEAKAAGRLRAAQTAGDAAIGATMFERAGGWNAGTGTDSYTSGTPVGKVWDTLNGGAGKGAGSGAGDYVIGDSIGVGLEEAGKASGTAKVGAQPDAILQMMRQLTPGQLKGRRIILSTGASNDPSKVGFVYAQLQRLVALGVDPKNIRILGVDADNPKFAGINAKLQGYAKDYGATFVPLGPTGGDHVHPSNYQKLWQGIPGASAGGHNAGVPLSHLQTVHPVTTSQTANSQHISGGINVHVAAGSDGYGIGSAIKDSLGRHGFAMMAQSGQV